MAAKMAELKRRRQAKGSSSKAAAVASGGGGDSTLRMGTDVSAVVVSTKKARPGRKPTFMCFLYDLGAAKCGANGSISADGSVLTLTPKPKSHTKEPLHMKPYQIIEVTNNSKSPDTHPDGTAIRLCNLTVNRGTTRTFYDVSFTRVDQGKHGFDTMLQAAHGAYFLPRYDPSVYQNDVLLPIGPFPTRESGGLVTHFVNGSISSIRDELTTGDCPDEIALQFGVEVEQWSNASALSDDDGFVTVDLPFLRCWKSTLSSFGILNTEHWEALAPLFLPLTPFYLRGYIHREMTEKMTERRTMTDTEYGMAVRVTSLIVDPLTMLKSVAVEIPKDFAMELCATRSTAEAVPTDGGCVWSLRYNGVVNLSEAGTSSGVLRGVVKYHLLVNIPDLYEGETLAEQAASSMSSRVQWLTERLSDSSVFCVFGEGDSTAPTPKRARDD
jgi:hypothetical protein